MPKPEEALKAQVIAFLNQTGTFYLRINSGKLRVKRGFMQLAPEGTADFLLCCPDPRWVELKAPGQSTAAKRKLAQDAFAEQVKGLGHRHAYVRSLDDLREFIKT